MIDQLPLLAAPHAARSTLNWFIDECVLPCYRALIPKKNVWQWADDHNVFLDGIATAEPGYYDSAKTPWAREFMETFTDPRFDEDHVIKSSRVGITEAALNVIRFMPGNCPGAALLAIDTTEEAKKIATDRLIPTLGADAKTDDDDDITRKLIRLRNMVINVSGSYSPTIFRNKWLRFAFLDEIEVVEQIDDEGTLHDLARSRQNDAPGAKLFTASKPKRWRSKHHCEVVTGTLSAYLVECPHCGTFQELSFDGTSPTHALRIEDSLRPGERPLSPPLGNFDPARGVYVAPPPPRVGRFRFEHCKDLLGQWDLARVEQETFYECASDAHCVISNAELKRSIRQTPGHWLQTNPRPVPRKRSRHIWDAYSLHAKLSLGHLARAFVEAQSDPSKLMHVVNNHFGLPWRERRAVVGDEQLFHCRAPYERGTVPFDPVLVTLCADTQDDCWKFVVAAYRLNGERAVVRWGRSGTRAELLDEFTRPIHHATDSTKIYYPTTGYVDAAGHRTDEVYDLHLESYSQVTGQFRLWPIFGRDFATNTKVVWWSDNPVHRFKNIRVYFCADDTFKRRLYLGSIAQAAEINRAIADGYEPAAKGLPPRLQLPGLPADPELRELMDELQSEQLIDADKGKWAKTRGTPNDYGDALKYCDVTFDFLKPILLAEENARRAQVLADEQRK